jgi:hypothetical protein
MVLNLEKLKNIRNLTRLLGISGKSAPRKRR